MTTKNDKPASIQKQYLPISSLKNWDKNPRSIKEKDFERLKTHIRDFGQMQPLVITPDGTVLGGNMRLRAYNALGMDDIWVQVVEPKDEADRLRIALILNDRAGYYDGDLLANLTGEYPDFNWEDYAVDLKEPQTLDEILDQYKEVEEDDVPELADGEAVSKLGEVYQLGRHRLMCGDATKIEDVEKLMNGQKAELLFTSPPYADMREYNGGKELSIEHLATVIPTHRMFASYQVINLGIQRKEGEVIQYWDDYILSAKNAGLKLLSWNIWNRESATSIGLQTAFFPIFHEWIFVFGNGVKELNRTKPKSEASYERQKYEKPGTRRKADGSLGISTKGDMSYDEVKIGTVTTLKAANTIGESEHPAIFPVSLPAEYIEAMTNEGDSVIDCFGGSGSTLIACEQTNRTCYMMELDPKYCDVIRKRYENFTKK